MTHVYFSLADSFTLVVHQPDDLASNMRVGYGTDQDKASAALVDTPIPSNGRMPFTHAIEWACEDGPCSDSTPDQFIYSHEVK